MLIITLLYLFFVLYLLIRILFIRDKEQVLRSIPPTGFSIIIPFRNEKPNLTGLIESLSKQNTTLPFELILVNDGSTDGFEPLLKDLLETYPALSVKQVDSQYNSELKLTSKQQAIDLGAAQSSFDWLIFSDADMVFSPDWIANLTACCDTESTPFVFGRTVIHKEKGLLKWVQAIQLDFLFVTGWLLAKVGLDSSCMGNNIALSRKLYEEIGGQKGIGFTIVEDKKLLSEIKKRGIKPTPAIPFSPDAETKAVDSYKTYLHQMLRWVKGGGSESIQIFLILALFGGELFAILFALLGKLSLLTSATAFSGALFTWILYITLFTKLKTARRGWQFPLFIFILTVESFVVLPALLFVSPTWKGRKLK